MFGALLDDPTSAPADGQTQLRSLLQEMDTEAPKGFGVRIERCENKVEAYVAKVGDRGKGLGWGTFHGHDVHDIDSLGIALWSEYGDVISKGHYSKRGKGPWEGFNQTELQTIRAFKQNDSYPF